MFGLGDTIKKINQDFFEPEKFLTKVLDERLQNIGIQLTKEQKADIGDQIRNNTRDQLTFDITDSQIESSNLNKSQLEEELIALCNELVPLAEEMVENLLDSHSEIFDDVIDKLVKVMLSSMKKRESDVLFDQEALLWGFGDSIQEFWETALKTMQLFLVAADEASAAYSAEERELFHNDSWSLFTNVYARSVLVSKEIFILLKNGFPDGALARWRKLHELSTVALCINEHGNSVATRFMEHERVEAYKAALAHNANEKTLGVDKISEDELEEMKHDYDYLLEKYGETYRYDYGWASEALKKKKPTFRDIEMSVSQDHLRSYYQMACRNVHAGAKGVLYTIGLLDTDDVLLAGPSNIGLSLPARLTIYSLNLISVTILNNKRDTDYLIASRVLIKLAEDAQAEFSKAEEQFFEES